MPTIGEQIRAARKAKGMTQDELASALNITRTGISKWETGDRVPDAEMLLHLSEVLEYNFTRSSAESVSRANEETGKPVKKEAPAERMAESPERIAAPAEETPKPGEVPAPSSKRLSKLPLICAAALALMILAAVIIILTRPKEDQL